jgi:hypothetical protein
MLAGNVFLAVRTYIIFFSPVTLLVTKLMVEAESGESLYIPVTAEPCILVTKAAPAGYATQTHCGSQTDCISCSGKTVAIVALATALVGEIAAIIGLVIIVAVSEETPCSLTELPLKTMQKLVSIWTNRE